MNRYNTVHVYKMFSHVTLSLYRPTSFMVVHYMLCLWIKGQQNICFSFISNLNLNMSDPVLASLEHFVKACKWMKNEPPIRVAPGKNAFS